MKKLVMMIAIMLTYGTGNAQNLVQNPSFEETEKIDNRWSGTFMKFNRKIKYWDSPTQGSPDILHVNFLDKMFPKRPNVDLSKHSPRTGDVMIGIKAYGCASKTLHCKEYLQIKLLEPLEKGVQYSFEFWISPINSSIKVNSFGIAVSPTRLQEYNVSSLLDIEAIGVSDKIIDNDEVEWQRISGVFEAEEAAEYLLIGNFYSDDLIEAKVEENGIDYAYYLIDDVSLKPLYPKKKEDKYETGQTIVLDNILFDFDKATLKTSSHTTLNDLVLVLTKETNISIEIRGHTDNKGKADYNLNLSQKRAESIQDYLIKKGIDATRLTAKGFGDKYPIINSETDENRAINRRVEIKIERKK